MRWNEWIRQSHRWTSIAFTAGVIVNIVALTKGTTPPVWVGLTALIPLILLLLSGLYLFMRPHATRWRSMRRAGSSSPTA